MTRKERYKRTDAEYRARLNKENRDRCRRANVAAFDGENEMIRYYYAYALPPLKLEVVALVSVPIIRFRPDVYARTLRTVDETGRPRQYRFAKFACCECGAAMQAETALPATDATDEAKREMERHAEREHCDDTAKIAY